MVMVFVLLHERMLNALRITAGNIRSLGPSLALEDVPRPYQEWLKEVEEAGSFSLEPTIEEADAIMEAKFGHTGGSLQFAEGVLRREWDTQKSKEMCPCGQFEVCICWINLLQQNAQVRSQPPSENCSERKP